MIDFMLKHHDKLLQPLLEHVRIVGVTLMFSLLFAAVFTIVSVYLPKLGDILIQVFALVYSIPSLALFALLIPVTGLGSITAVIVLVAYNQYLLLRNIITGIREVDSAVVEAATGLGMRRIQLLISIQLPLAKKSIFTGIQLAVVSSIGIATIAALINAGGLGTLLFDGLRTLNTVKIVWGSLLSAGLAIGMNEIFKRVEKKF